MLSRWWVVSVKWVRGVERETWIGERDEDDHAWGE